MGMGKYQLLRDFFFNSNTFISAESSLAVGTYFHHQTACTKPLYVAGAHLWDTAGGLVTSTSD